MAKNQPVHDACNVPTSHHPHGQTAACENIIFPELHLRAVTSKFLLASFYSASGTQCACTTHYMGSLGTYSNFHIEILFRLLLVLIKFLLVRNQAAHRNSFCTRQPDTCLCFDTQIYNLESHKSSSY